MSEEDPPISCASGSVVTGANCKGSYCDNIRLYCVPTFTATGSFWTDYFSEEGSNFRVCPYNSWMTGIQCKGSYCDDISLLCTYFTPPPGYSPPCQWSGWMSEENGGVMWFNGRVRGVACNGSYCDNKNYFVCNY